MEILLDRKDSGAIKIDFADDELRLTARNLEGEASDAIDMDVVEGNAGHEVGVNAHYLRDTLTHLATERVTIGVHDAGSPLRFTADDDPDILHIIMPMGL